MTIPDNQKSNGRGLVATYLTNPFWYSSMPPSGEYGSDSYVLLYGWTGGLTVPIFEPTWLGWGNKDNQDTSITLTDRVDDSRKVKFYTDEDVVSWPLGTERNMGNIFHSCSESDHDIEKFGIRKYKTTSGGEETLQEVSKRKQNKKDGPFHVNCPDSGLDHVTSFYWGPGKKVRTAKIKNIIGLHWMEMTAKGDDQMFFAWINKICFLYQDANGDEVPLIPIGNAETGGPKDIIDFNYSPDKEDGNWSGPGCCAHNQDSNKRGGTNSGHGALRGAFLDPEQVKYVIDNQLELKGMWIEVYRRTSRSAKKADPQGWFWGMFPWILDETTPGKFGKYYLHPYDYMNSKFGYNHDADAKKGFNEKWYTDEDLRKREEYFTAYHKEIIDAGGWDAGVHVDPSGKFSKKILVPAVHTFEADPLRYTDDRSALQMRKEDDNGFIVSNL